MKREILFLHPNKANLPELKAYTNYFSPKFNVTVSSDYYQDISKFDIIWIIMGTKSISKSNEKQILIHEYASLSTGPYPSIKNFLKKFLINKPDIRIFLNEFVKNEFNFKDQVRYGYRDMGISTVFFDKKVEEIKQYEFVYVGDISRRRKMDIFLTSFIKAHTESLLLVGKYDKDIYDRFSKYDNIKFVGKVPYENVPKQIKKAKYAINFIPNEYPYNLQTSTKLQEYVALGMNVITCDGDWVREFERRNKCNFFYIDDKKPFIDDDYKKFDYKSKIDPSKYTWESVLDNSRILEIIESV